jgi:hypothetical protein
MPDQCDTVNLFDELCAQINAQRPGEGFSPADILTMPDPLAALLNQLVRQGELTAAQIAAAFNLTGTESEQVVNLLLQQGFVVAGSDPVSGPATYKARLAPKRQRRVQTDLWKVLDL